MKLDISSLGDLPDEALISAAVIAKVYMGVGISTAQRRIYNDPDFPRPVKFSSRCVRYRVGEVRKYIKRIEAETPAQLAAKKSLYAMGKQPEASTKKSKSRTRASA